MKEFWNQRYQNTEYVYGKEANVFFSEQLQKLKPNTLLLPAEGEGRNAVFAAKLGWEVTGLDYSEEAKKKALKLAKENQVNLIYHVGDIMEMELAQYDVMGLIYAHFPIELRSAYFQKLIQNLKQGAYVILEGFSKNHLTYQAKNPTVGGPKNEAMLFSIEEIQQEFSGFEILELEEKVIQLKEGKFHQGEGSVIRFVGKKK